MIILTPYSQAVNALHVTRIFLQADRQMTDSPEHPAGFHVMLELASRRHLVATDSLPERQAQSVLKELTRHWVQDRAFADIAAILRRLTKHDVAETESDERARLWST